MLKYNVYDKIKYIVKNVNSVFITNISNLGRESLALNRKSFFFHHFCTITTRIF